MKASIINEADIAGLKVASLPSRPTAPSSFGGRGFTATEMKEAFDKLPLYLVDKFNLLIQDISEEGEDSLAASVPTGIRSAHTLSDMFSDVISGVFSTYLAVSGASLSDCVSDLQSSEAQSRAMLSSHDNSIRSVLSLVTAHSDRLSALEASLAELGAKVDNIDTGGDIDTENLALDCGNPEDLASEKGGAE